MKHYDKIFLAISVLACLAGAGVYLGMKPDAKSSAKSSSSPKGAEIARWEDKTPEIKSGETWKAPEPDLVAGWNYDLFNSPETTWLTADSKYIAKELPPPVDDPFGIRLVSMEMPIFPLRISTVACSVPPVLEKNKDGQKIYRALVKFETAKGEVVSLDFSRLPGTRMEKSEEGGRVLIKLTPKKPASLVGQNAAIKSLSIVKGESETGDGTKYTRYMATIVDREDKDANVNVGETFLRKTNVLEAVFQDTDSTTQWRYVEKNVPGSDVPQVEIYTRASPGEPYTSLGSEPSFKKNGATYFVKGLDFSTQEATITKQSESNRKTKRPKVRQQVLTPEK